MNDLRSPEWVLNDVSAKFVARPLCPPIPAVKAAIPDWQLRANTGLSAPKLAFCHLKALGHYGTVPIA